jgi:hypothetical protein
MALVAKRIFPAAESAIERAVARIEMDTGGAGGFGDVITDDSPVHAAAPQLLYTLNLPDLAEGQPLERSAVCVGERYLVLQSEHPVASAEIRQVEGRALRASLTFGPFARSTEEALSWAERLPTVREHDYQVRFIAQPDIYLMAIWLKALQPGIKDVVIPLSPAPKGLEALRQYDVPMFEGWIRRQLSSIRSMAHPDDDE